MHRPLATIQGIIQAHVQRVRDHGLVLTLTEERLTEPIQLARLFGELERTNLHVDDCRDAIPIVQRCRALHVRENQVNELIEAALRIGEPEFPREDFTNALLRILRLERETGQTVQQMQATFQQRLAQTEEFNQQRDHLRNNIRTLERRRNELNNGVRNAESRLEGLRQGLEAAELTQQQLTIYVQDRDFLRGISIDIRDVQRISAVYQQLRSFSFSIQQVVTAALEIPSLNHHIETLRTNRNQLQDEVNQLTQERNELTQQIQQTEQQLQESSERLRQQREKEEQEIKESEERIKQQLDKEHITEQQLSDFLDTRNTLAKAGIEI